MTEGGTVRRHLGGDDRGAAVLVGAVAVLALGVLLLAMWQVSVVPSDLRTAEIEHSQGVSDDVAGVAERARAVAGADNERTATVRLGPEYPQYRLLVGAPPATGRLTSGPTGTVTVANATATDVAGTYWNGEPRSVPTRTLRYDPSYDEYDQAPTTVLEHGVVVDRYEDGERVAERPQAVGRLVEGNRIDLVALTGDLQRSGSGETAVDLAPVSAPERSVAVTGTGGDPIVLELPTTLSVETWETVLADERRSENPEGNVLRVEPADAAPDDEYDRVRIVLAGDERYDLRLAQVGLGDAATRQRPAYIVPTSEQVDTDDGVVSAEVRDRFDNPVAGAEVAVAGHEVCDVGPTATTDADGRVRFVCDPASGRLVNLSVDGGEELYETVFFRRGEVTVPATTWVDRFEVTVTDTRFQTADDTRRRDLLQYEVAFRANDTEAVDRVAVELVDDQGTVVTAETLDYDGQQSVDGQFTSPLLADEGLDARLRVRGRTGTVYEVTEAVPDPPRGSIAGRVLDAETGDPIAGATVAVSDDAGIRTATTDADGRYNVTDLRPGPYEVSADADGYQASEPRTVTVGPTGTNERGVDVSLTPAPGETAIVGQITDQGTGAPVGGARVVVTDTDGTEFTALTDADGNYAVGGLDSGSYDVYAEADGYNPQVRQDVAVAAGETVTVDLAVQELVGQAADIELVDARLTPPGTSQVAFTVRNRGTAEATFTRLTLLGTSNDVDRVRMPGRNQPRFENLDTGTALVTRDILVGTEYGLSQSQTLGAGTQSRYELKRFERGPEGTLADMTNAQVYVRLRFSDGSVRDLVLET